MTYPCVTTFGPEYYEKYGRESIVTMDSHWPGRVIAYGEGKKPADLPARVEYRDLYGQPDFARFVEWSGAMPITRGFLPDGSYNYHFNMHKFGRKAFVVTDMKEPFYFVGADVHAVKAIPAALLDKMLDGKFGAFLFRRDGMHTESDFAGYNTRHKSWEQFSLNYRAMYTHGMALAVPSVDPEFRGFHDCWSLDFLIKHMNLKPECYDITGDARGDDAKGFHVWPKTELGEYMIHLKGRIKKDPAKKAAALQGAA